jgi:hypothetical protein
MKFTGKTRSKREFLPGKGLKICLSISRELKGLLLYNDFSYFIFVSGRLWIVGGFVVIHKNHSAKNRISEENLLSFNRESYCRFDNYGHFMELFLKIQYDSNKHKKCEKSFEWIDIKKRKIICPGLFQ